MLQQDLTVHTGIMGAAVQCSTVVRDVYRNSSCNTAREVQRNLASTVAREVDQNSWYMPLLLSCRCLTYLQEYSSNRVQGLLWPGLKPVNDCVVHQAREVTAACPQSLANRGHGQHYMQVVAALQHKLCPAGLLAVIQTLLHCLHKPDSVVANLVQQYCNLVDSKEEVVLMCAQRQMGIIVCTAHDKPQLQGRSRLAPAS